MCLDIICRGQHEKARKTLEWVRGTKNVDTEFEEIVGAVAIAETNVGQWGLLFSPRNRGVLVIHNPFVQP